MGKSYLSVGDVAALKACMPSFTTCPVQATAFLTNTLNKSISQRGLGQPSFVACNVWFPLRPPCFTIPSKRGGGTPFSENCTWRVEITVRAPQAAPSPGAHVGGEFQVGVAQNRNPFPQKNTTTTTSGVLLASLKNHSETKQKHSLPRTWYLTGNGPSRKIRRNKNA